MGIQIDFGKAFSRPTTYLDKPFCGAMVLDSVSDNSLTSPTDNSFTLSFKMTGETGVEYTYTHRIFDPNPKYEGSLEKTATQVVHLVTVLAEAAGAVPEDSDPERFVMGTEDEDGLLDATIWSSLRRTALAAFTSLVGTTVYGKIPGNVWQGKASLRFPRYYPVISVTPMRFSPSEVEMNAKWESAKNSGGEGEGSVSEDDPEFVSDDFAM